MEFDYHSGWVGVWWSDKTKLILILTLVEVVVEVEVELGKNETCFRLLDKHLKDPYTTVVCLKFQHKQNVINLEIFDMIILLPNFIVL